MAALPSRRAANGHGNARSLAVSQAAVSDGGEYGGRRLLGPATLDQIFREQCNGTDLVIGMPMRSRDRLRPARRAAAAGVAADLLLGRLGGSLVINDLDAGMTFVYVMNRMGEGTVGDDRGFRLLAAVYGALGA